MACRETDSNMYEVQVRWTRATCQGQTLDRWFASVERPTFTQGFAQVERIDGQWWLIVFPQWSIRQHPELTEQRIPYQSATKAKVHLEAWVLANWPAIKRRFGIYTPLG